MALSGINFTDKNGNEYELNIPSEYLKSIKMRDTSFDVYDADGNKQTFSVTMPTVDSAFSNSSTNAIQNKIVSARFKNYNTTITSTSTSYIYLNIPVGSSENSILFTGSNGDCILISRCYGSFVALRLQKGSPAVDYIGYNSSSIRYFLGFPNNNTRYDFRVTEIARQEGQYGTATIGTTSSLYSGTTEIPIIEMPSGSAFVELSLTGTAQEYSYVDEDTQETITSHYLVFDIGDSDWGLLADKASVKLSLSYAPQEGDNISDGAIIVHNFSQQMTETDMLIVGVDGMVNSDYQTGENQWFVEGTVIYQDVGGTDPVKVLSTTYGIVDNKMQSMGSGTDVKVDGTSITSNNEANLQTINSNYDATTNPLATQNDLPTLQNISFTDDDARWGSVDSQGLYTLTIVSSKTPVEVFKNITNNKWAKVHVEMDYDGTYVYIVTDEPFSGIVSVW